MRKPMTLAAAVAATLLLAGCANKLSSDLGSAEDHCQDQKFATKTALVDCLDAQDRPVWAKEQPSTLDLYDKFAQQRKDLAEQYDKGSITAAQYHDRLHQVEDDIRAQMTTRREQTAAKPAAASPAVTSP